MASPETPWVRSRSSPLTMPWRVIGGGWNLLYEQCPSVGVENSEVRERPADIDPDAPVHHAIPVLKSLAGWLGDKARLPPISTG